MTGDGHALEYCECGFADGECAAFEAIGFGDLLEAFFAVLMYQRLLGEDSGTAEGGGSQFELVKLPVDLFGDGGAERTGRTFQNKPKVAHSSSGAQRRLARALGGATSSSGLK